MELLQAENGPLQRVLKYLEFVDLLRLQRVSKLWKKVCLQILEPVVAIREIIRKSYLKDWTYYGVNDEFLKKVRENQLKTIAGFIRVSKYLFV